MFFHLKKKRIYLILSFFKMSSVKTKFEIKSYNDIKTNNNINF